MWTNDKNFPARGFSTPPPTWKSKPSYSPTTSFSEKRRVSPLNKADLFHVIHKVPAGDSPYVKAKQVQLIEKDPSRAISLFWAAINSGDRVDSALKDMAVVMKQLNRSEEAIEAIKSFRHLCPHESQESLDNVLVELYKRSGRIEEQIEMLQRKLKCIEEGMAFGGKKTKLARSQGKKFHITIAQERSRLLGNLAWAYLQQNNYTTAEELYRKALSLEPDNNKKCNLALCLMHMNRITEAKSLLLAVRAASGDGQMDESYAKSFERAFEMLTELESQSVLNPTERQENNPKEIRRSFTSPLNRNSRELSTSINGGDDGYVSDFVVSRTWADGHDNEPSRGSYSRNQHENKDDFSGFENRNSKSMLFVPKSGSQSSPRTFFVDKWKKGSYFENPYEKSDFASKRKENWASTTGIEVGSAHKKTYASPVPVSGNSKVPFTEPRRCSWLFNNEDQRRGLWGADTGGSSNRKLSFEGPITTENARALAPHKLNGELPVSMNEKSKVSLRKGETNSPPPISGDWRRRSREDLAPMKNEVIESISHPIMNGDWKRKSWENDEYARVKNEAAAVESVSQPIANGVWKRNSWENNGLKKFPTKERISPNLQMESPITVKNARAQATFIDGDRDQSSDITSAGNVRSTDIIEDKRENNSTKSDSTGNPKPTQDFSIYKSKKSWADMVEEDEQELLNGIADFLDYPSHRSSFSFQIPSKCFDDWNIEEEFNDENLNSNIIRQTNPMENLSQKLKSFDLKDGDTRTGNAVSSRNSTARRSLCFDQLQKPDSADYYCSSPLPKKALNLEGYNYGPENERKSTSGNSIKLKRRNRLQVFRDITLLPESPQA